MYSYELTGVCVNRLAFLKYRKIRIVFWVTFIGAFVPLFVSRPGFSAVFFIVAWIAAMISIFMPCPFCGKKIGFRWYGPFVAGNAFGGWCLHCGTRLFGIKNIDHKTKESLL